MSEPVTRFVVGKREGGKRLDQFLHERIPGLSRTRIQEAIRHRVTLSWGVKARPSTSVRAGGEVTLRLSYRAPLDWDGLLGFLRLRQIPGVEMIEGRTYRRTIELEEPIRALGVYNILLRLHPEVTATVKLWVVKE